MNANASQVELGILPESVWGALPSPATFQLMRFTGENLDIQRENVVSNEIRPDRNVSDLIQVGGGAGGSLNFELSYGTFDALLESVMNGVWSTSPANILKNGVAQKSFHVQKKLETGATDVFYLYKGMVVDTMSLNIAAKQIVTGSFGMIGKGGTVGTSVTGTNTNATTEPVMNAASHFTLSAAGVSPAPELLSVSLNLANGLGARPVVGSVDSIGIRTGRFNVTGSFQAYFATKALADMFLAGTAGALTFTIGAEANKKYTFTIPTFKITNCRVAAGGNDQDVVYACDFQGLYNSGIAATLQITRAVA